MKTRILFVWLLLALPDANAANLLIQGATLIDGTGRPPITDARILIEGNVVRRIWRGAEAAPRPPPGTQIVDAPGKVVIPRPIDSPGPHRPHTGEEFFGRGGEALLYLGRPPARGQ